MNVVLMAFCWHLQGMSLGIGISGTAVSAISFLTLAAVPRHEGEPSPAEVAPAAFAYFLGKSLHESSHLTWPP